MKRTVGTWMLLAALGGCVSSEFSPQVGDAVPQIYVHLPGAPGRVQPPRQLKAFDSVTSGRAPRGG